MSFNAGGKLRCLKLPASLELKRTRSRKSDEAIRLWLTKKFILVSKEKFLRFKPIDHDPLEDDSNNVLELAKTHPFPINCLSLEEEGNLVVSCCEEEINLMKFDPLLKEYSSTKIGKDIGKTQACSLIWKNRDIFTVVAKSSEIILIHCVNGNTNSETLNLESIDIVATCERNCDGLIWIHLIFFNDKLHLVGITSGNVISFKLWEVVTAEETFKLKDHKMSSGNLKCFACADLVKLEAEEWGLLVVSTEGYMEFLAIRERGFNVISRIKLTDPTKIIPNLDKSVMGDSTSAEIDFRIFSAKFMKQEENRLPVSDPASNQSNMAPIQKLLVAFVYSKGISIVNLLSGETETVKLFKDLYEDQLTFVISEGRISTTGGVGKLTCCLIPILNQNMYIFELDEPGSVKDAAENSDFTLVSRAELQPRSILRKKLKSPPPPPHELGARRRRPGVRCSLPKGQGSLWGNLRNKDKQCSSKSDVLPSWVVTGNPSSTQHPPSTISNKDSAKLGQKKKIKEPPVSPPGTSRVGGKIRIKPKSTYDQQIQEAGTNGLEIGEVFSISTSLSEINSHMRMCFASDGSSLAVGGSHPPLILFKPFPCFEQLSLYKESQKINSLNFSFSNKYLIRASNDGKTDVINWKNQKLLLSFQFSSKFNEHLHSQFYCLDKFILQPEGCNLILYAYRIGLTNTVSLKAGSFPIQCQKITAVSAPNQFYSYTILCGGSNKSLVAFDANTEQSMFAIQNVHSKPISVIRINEFGKGEAFLNDVFLTSAASYSDPIKLWDLRTPKCILRISDGICSSKNFSVTSRPSMSPCGRYIVSGFEESTISLYDIRRVNSRVSLIPTASTVLDSCFDLNFPLIWCTCRNGSILTLDLKTGTFKAS